MAVDILKPLIKFLLTNLPALWLCNLISVFMSLFFLYRLSMNSLDFFRPKRTLSLQPPHCHRSVGTGEGGRVIEGCPRRGFGTFGAPCKTISSNLSRTDSSKLLGDKKEGVVFILMNTTPFFLIWKEQIM